MNKISDSTVFNAIEINCNDIENIDMTDPEKGTEEQLKAILTEKKQKKKISKNRIDIIRQSKYFFCVYFLSEAQKIEFLQKSGFNVNGNEVYIDGLELANFLNIQITKDNDVELPTPEYVKSFKKGG